MPKKSHSAIRRSISSRSSPGRLALDFGERAARLGIPPGAKQDLGAAEIALVARPIDDALQLLQLRGRGNRGVGQRVFVVDAIEGFRGLALLARGERRTSQPRQHVVVDRGLGFGERRVDCHRRFGIAQRFRSLRFAQRRADREVPAGLRSLSAWKNRASFRRPRQPQLRETGVVRRVVGERRRRQRRAAHERERCGIVAGRVTRRAVDERLVRGERAFAHVVIGRDQPELARGRGQRRVGGRRELVARRPDVSRLRRQQEDQREREDSQSSDHG